MPSIIEQIINHDQATEEIKHKLADLVDEIKSNASIKPLNDSQHDVAVWNSQVELWSTWLDTPWLFVECYMYRRIHSISSIDLFSRQKMLALDNCWGFICVLKNDLFDMCSEESKLIEFINHSLWSNQVDLSLHVDTDEQQDIANSRMEVKNRLLVDHKDRLLKYLLNSDGSKQIHMVLDNSGFELFCDLCLAYLLIEQKIASRVVLHIKQIPWFVSDTTQNDLDHIMQRLKNDPETRHTYTLFNALLASKKWVVEADAFWTLPHSFHEMKTCAPVLFSRLFMTPDDTHMVIFKGDLNYRKLLNDCFVADECKSFSDSIGYLAESSVPICALRTCKSDPICGLAPGLASDVCVIDSEWLTNGKWGKLHTRSR